MIIPNPMQKSTRKLHLFEAFGLELEYMIVDINSLAIAPITDQLFFEFNGNYSSDVEREPISWSNELALHVLELKTPLPTPNLEKLPQDFQREVALINQHLKKWNACLMPTAMHPWMDPFTETKLWPHEYNAIYSAFNRIFDCRGHGWSNLQSTHINLPFGNEEEFVALHAAIRLVLPLIPALAASSPLIDGKVSSWKDTRLETYRQNCKKIPSITGAMIPEICRSINDYKTLIFDPIEKDLEPHDPEKILVPEWTNARGAIARFDRQSIEIRLIDIQESPLADMAIASFFISLTKWLSKQPLEKLHSFSVQTLKEILLTTIREGEEAFITQKSYLHLFGLSEDKIKASELLSHLFLEVLSIEKIFHSPLQTILSDGTLSTRILKALEKEPLPSIYARLCHCLNNGDLFLPCI